LNVSEFSSIPIYFALCNATSATFFFAAIFRIEKGYTLFISCSVSVFS
jgi:hypothetical protein